MVEAQAPKVKKPYVTPKLVRLGTVRELTQGGMGSVADGVPARHQQGQGM